MSGFLETKEGFEVIDRLAEMTRRRKLEWQIEGPYEFSVSLPHYDVWLASRDSDDGHPFILEFTARKQGAQTASTTTGTDVHPNLVARIEGLYRVVKGVTLGLDDLARNLLEDLNQVEHTYGPDEAPF
jgi:hypothetical protein